MASWKAVLGLGAACAACCAVPLAGAVGAAGVTATLAAAGAAVLSCADELAMPVAVVAAMALLYAVWRRRKPSKASNPAACAYPAGSVCAPTDGCQGCQTARSD